MKKSQNKVILIIQVKWVLSIVIGILAILAVALPSRVILAENIVSFTADTTLTFSPDASPAISVKSGSATDVMTINTTVLGATVPQSANFTLKNSSGDLLDILPANATAVLEVDVSTDYTSSRISTWKESSAGAATVAHTVAVAGADTWYQITANGTAVNNYKSSSNNFLNFNYTLGLATTTFAIASANGPLNSGSPVASGGGGGSSSSSQSQRTTTIQQPAAAIQSQGLQISNAELLAKVIAQLKILGVKIPAGAEKQIQAAAQPTESTPAATATEPAVEEEEAIELQPLTRVLTIGARGEDVKALQQFLKDQGEDIYPEGLVSGYFGQMTLRAVQKFQEENDIAQKGVLGYGIVGPKTRALINKMIGGAIETEVSEDTEAVEAEESADTTAEPTEPVVEEEEEEAIELQPLTRVLTIGARGEDVKALQQFLKDQGEDIYPEGLVSGYFGQMTLRAVQKFQEENDIAQKGVLGYGIVGPKTRALINKMIGGAIETEVSEDTEAVEAEESAEEAEEAVEAEE